MMEVKELSFHYTPASPILQDIAFRALPCECLAVLGNNGAGKSTLLKCLNRILRPQGGTVLVEKSSVLKMPLHSVARRMAFVAQDSGKSRLTVYDMVMLGRKPFIKWGASREDKEIVEGVLRQMRLDGMAARFVDELSGGERQKVMLARALAQRPRVLLLDEPTSSLDLCNQYGVMELVRKACRENGIAVVIVIHDLNLALRFCDKFMLIRENRIYGYGGREVITAESIGAVYQIPVDIHSIGGELVVIPRQPLTV